MSKIHDAVRKGDVALTKRLLHGGFLRRPADANERDRHSGETPLGLAAAEGHVELAKLLLEKGAKKDACHGRREPLAIAVANGHVELAKLLLEKGANTEAEDNKGDRPLAIAVANGHVELAKLLIDNGADIEAKNSSRRDRPLGIAAVQGHIELAKLLLEKGANTEAQDNRGDRPLAIAVANGHVELAKLLIDHGADIEAENNRHDRPLATAVANGHVELAKLLIEKGAEQEPTTGSPTQPRTTSPPGEADCAIDPLRYVIQQLIGQPLHWVKFGSVHKAINCINASSFCRVDEGGYAEAPDGVLFHIAHDAATDEATLIVGGTGITPAQMEEIAVLAVEKFGGKLEKAYIRKTPEWASLKDYIVAWIKRQPKGTALEFGLLEPKTANVDRGGTEPSPCGRITVRLRKLIPDFDGSQDEGIARLRRLCEEDPGMARVPKGIEQQFFLLLMAQIDSGYESDYGMPAGLWEANLDWADKESEPREQPSAAVQTATIQLYNQGVSLYEKGEFKAAMDAFAQVFESGELKMQSAYARGLCQKELGLAVEIPADIGDKAEDAGTVYVASNLACHLIAKGHKAALTQEGGTSEVTALIDGALYVVSISSLLGGFNTWAWRKEDDKSISIPDPGANPDPTETDRFVISLAEQAGVLPPSPMPESGLKTTWE